VAEVFLRCAQGGKGVPWVITRFLKFFLGGLKVFEVTVVCMRWYALGGYEIAEVSISVTFSAPTDTNGTTGT
jgi:hypothetical protein